MKKYRTQAEFEKGIKNRVFSSGESIDITEFDLTIEVKIEVTGDINARNIDVQDIFAGGNINARDIFAWNISAGGNIDARDIDAAGNINAWNINAQNINAQNINTAGEITVKGDINIKGNISAWLIIARNIKTSGAGAVTETSN